MYFHWCFDSRGLVFLASLPVATVYPNENYIVRSVMTGRLCKVSARSMFDNADDAFKVAAFYRKATQRLNRFRKSMAAFAFLGGED